MRILIIRDTGDLRCLSDSITVRSVVFSLEWAIKTLCPRIYALKGVLEYALMEGKYFGNLCRSRGYRISENGIKPLGHAMNSLGYRVFMVSEAGVLER